MSVNWYAKLESGFHSNRKSRRAGRGGREVFVFVLCMNAQRGSQGWIPLSDLDPWYLREQLQMDSEQEAEDAVTSAVTADLIAIDGDRVAILGWTDDYAKRPKTRAEIQKDYRDRQSNRYDPEVTSYAQSNALPREEGRKEGREDGNALSGSQAKVDTRPRRTQHPEAGQPLASAWQPPDTLTALARSLGLDAEHELAQFRLNARARGHHFADFDAAFEKFIRGSRDKLKTPTRKPGSTTQKQRPARVVLENGLVVETAPDGTERVFNEDGSPYVAERFRGSP